jgi:hypothetical protein
MNLVKYHDTDFETIYSWHRLYSGNALSNIWPVFSNIYPFIVVFPFGFSFIQDRDARVLAWHIRRSGQRRYFRSKLIVAFIGGFIVIAIPFLINMLLCYATFPHNYNSDLQYYSWLTGENVFRDTVFAHKPFPSLFAYSLFLYNIVFLTIFSCFSGLLSMFTMGCSFFIRRYKIMLLIPLFVIFQAGSYLSGVIYDYNNQSIRYFNTNLLDYISTDAFYGQSVPFIASFLSAICLFIVIAYRYATRKEYIV